MVSGRVPSPRVTVVIATYNWAPVLPYAIGSVLDQTFQDFELLVIGDACTDESEAVVTSIPDPRVRWLNLARNTGHQS
ncbi:MAG TPA: glycosyltransferase, partial [Acidimicrobiia bacterium]|nr:glycosyltransferase [Acidimicrobiia bacterium]